MNQAEPSLVYDDKPADVQNKRARTTSRTFSDQSTKAPFRSTDNLDKKDGDGQVSPSPITILSYFNQIFKQILQVFFRFKWAGLLFLESKKKQQRNLPQSCCFSHHRHHFLTTGRKRLRSREETVAFTSDTLCSPGWAAGRMSRSRWGSRPSEATRWRPRGPGLRWPTSLRCDCPR